MWSRPGSAASAVNAAFPRLLRARGGGVNREAHGAPPQSFVRLRDVAPGIVEDVRYAGPDNFTGAPVPGYEVAECWLLAPVAQALARVAREAQGRGLALVVWDAYRPQRASDYFLRWSREPEDGEEAARLRGRFHPGVDRRDLFARGFLSERSSHSKGAAVDLGLLDGAGGLLDFGAPFDFFDAVSATGSADVPPAARANRALLLALMAAQGFRNYEPEWWHYGHPAGEHEPLHDWPIG